MRVNKSIFELRSQCINNNYWNDFNTRTETKAQTYDVSIKLHFKHPLLLNFYQHRFYFQQQILDDWLNTNSSNYQGIFTWLAEKGFSVGAFDVIFFHIWWALISFSSRKSEKYERECLRSRIIEFDIRISLNGEKFRNFAVFYKPVFPSSTLFRAIESEWNLYLWIGSDPRNVRNFGIFPCWIIR